MERKGMCRDWMERVVSRDGQSRNVKDKDCQEITQSTAVSARGSGVVPIGPPLSL